MEKIIIENNYFNFLAVNGYPLAMILWNFILAGAAWLIFILLERLWHFSKFKKISHKILAVFLSFLWLIFFPNIPYIITDIRHISDYCPPESYANICQDNAWMIMFFLFYSLSGLVLFVFFLNKVSLFLKNIYGDKKSAIIIFSIIPLISLGVLVGLLNRLNSWDVFLRPWLVGENLLRYFTTRINFLNFLIFTAGFYLFYYLGRRFRK